MSNRADVYDEPFVSEEQEKRFQLIQEIAQQIDEQIVNAREKALSNLMDSKLTSNQKKICLQKYFDFHLNPKNIITIAKDGKQYCLFDIPDMAKALYDDVTFPYSDSDVILNWLAFWNDSFDFDDEILAFHLYRLEKSDKNLSSLIYVVGLYISDSLRITFDGLQDYDNALSLPREKSIEVLKKLLIQVKNVLDNCKGLVPFQSQKYILYENDFKLSFSDRMDFDAGADVSKSIVAEPDPFYEKYHGHPEPKKSEEEIEKEINEIDAWHDLKMLSQCIRSVYLLSAIITLVGTEFFDKEILSIGKKCRRLCDHLFDDDNDSYEGAYEKISSEKRMNYFQLEAEENNANANSKEAIFSSFLDIISDEIQSQKNIEVMLQRRIEWLTTAKASLKEETIEKIERIISLPISNKLIQISQNKDSFELFRKKVQGIFGDKANMLNESIINTLATAELLFDEYANGSPIAGFDYSGISALYYQALENTYNSLFWGVYAQYLNGYMIGDKYFTSLVFKEDSQALGYWPLQYGYIKNSNFFNKKQKRVKEACTFGAFNELLKMYDLNVESACGFLTQAAIIFGFKNSNEMINNLAFMEILKSFRDEFGKSSFNRNNASHGTEIINQQQCEKDKITILAEERHNSIGLIAKFLSLFQ